MVLVPASRNVGQNFYFFSARYKPADGLVAPGTQASTPGSPCRPRLPTRAGPSSRSTRPHLGRSSPAQGRNRTQLSWEGVGLGAHVIFLPLFPFLAVFATTVVPGGHSLTVLCRPFPLASSWASSWANILPCCTRPEQPLCYLQWVFNRPGVAGAVL